LFKRHIIQEKKTPLQLQQKYKEKTTLAHNCKLEIVEHLTMHETQKH
jgi:hypothetical protein